tara:strand:- start:253 stop:378 length:126 start_codon:yes stop_codon:yes gene_type:complete
MLIFKQSAIQIENEVRANPKGKAKNNRSVVGKSLQKKSLSR